MEPESKFCRGCGTDITGKGIEFCPKCAKQLELAGKLQRLFEPDNEILLAGLSEHMAIIAKDSQDAMCEAIGRNDYNTAAVECGVFQNANAFIGMITDTIHRASRLLDKPKDEESI